MESSMPLTDKATDMVAPQPIMNAIGDPSAMEVFGLPGAGERILATAANTGFSGNFSPRPLPVAAEGTCGMDAICKGSDAIVAWGNNYELHAEGPDDGPKATPDIREASSL
jgi:hypothetical protein